MHSAPSKIKWVGRMQQCSDGWLVCSRSPSVIDFFVSSSLSFRVASVACETERPSYDEDGWLVATRWASQRGRHREKKKGSARASVTSISVQLVSPFFSSPKERESERQLQHSPISNEIDSFPRWNSKGKRRGTVIIHLTARSRAGRFWRQHRTCAACSLPCRLITSRPISCKKKRKKSQQTLLRWPHVWIELKTFPLQAKKKWMNVIPLEKDI